MNADEIADFVASVQDEFGEFVRQQWRHNTTEDECPEWAYREALQALLERRKK